MPLGLGGEANNLASPTMLTNWPMMQFSAPYDEFMDNGVHVVSQARTLAELILHSDDTLARRLGWGFGAVFVVGSIAYGHCCAGGVDLFVYMAAALLSTVGLLLQSELVSFSFRRRLQAPIIRLYEEEGVRTSARVVQSKSKGKGTNMFREVILVYKEVNSTALFTKTTFELSNDEAGELQDTELPILILPEIPTSAILKQKYDDISDPWSDGNIFRFSVSLISPVLWCWAIRYSFTTEIYDYGNAFIQGGLLWLFCVSLVSSLCWAYAWTLTETKSWLHGGARPIGDAHALPAFEMA